MALCRPIRYGDIDESEEVHDEIRAIGAQARAAIIAQRTMDEDAILHGLRQHGPSAGARQMMRLEKEAGDTAIATGMYVVFRHVPTGKDCCRVGPSHRCFCNHTLSEHNTNKKCKLCPCDRFSYIPNRPEEIGEEFLARRANFNPATWFAKCRCGHGHNAHNPKGSHRCTLCGCGGYESHFGCVVCDTHWEEHETVFETAQQRRSSGRTTGDAYQPLAQVDPEFAQIVFGARHPNQREIDAPPPASIAALPGGRRLVLGAPRAPAPRVRCAGCSMVFSGTQCSRCGARVPPK